MTFLRTLARLLVFLSLAAVITSFSKEGSINTISYNRISMNGEVSMDFSKLFEVIGGIQIEESDESVFSYISVEGLVGDDIVLHDLMPSKRICVIDNRGKVVSVVSRQGRGPQEYLEIGNLAVDESRRMLYVQDVASKKEIYRYSFDGTFCGAVPLKYLPSGMLINDGYLYVTNLPGATSSYSVYSLDDMELKYESSILKETRKTAMVYYDKIFELDGSVFYQQALTNTVYKINQDRMTPFLCIDHGKYTMPLKYLSSIDLIDRHERSYINGYSYNMSTDYLFAEYYYGNKRYFDIWKYKEGKLIYHHKADIFNNRPGFPITVNGQTVRAWPIYIHSDTVICEVYTMNKKGPFWTTENNNPVLLKLKIK